MRLAYASPLPPLTSGIADYSAELAPALAAGGAELELFHEGRIAPPSPLAAEFTCSPVRDLPRRARDFDLVLYHLGNSAPHHAEILDTLLEVPGVTMLHEFQLHHLVRERTLAAGRPRAYVEEMRYCAGESGRRAAQRLLDTHYPVDPWRYPLFERVVDRSRAILVHSEFARERILRSRPAARVGVVPFPVAPAASAPAGEADRRQARARLGLGDDDLVFASFGFVTPQKRLEPALAAFARLRGEMPRARFLVVGEVSPHYDLEEALEAAGREGVTVTGRLPLGEFDAAMKAVDVAVNLRHPTGGETSASLLRLLARGVPTIVTRAGSFAELPEGVVAKVPIDEREEDLLLAFYRALAEDVGLRASLGRAARRHVAERHELPGAAEAWLRALEPLCATPAGVPSAAPPLAPWDGVEPRVALAAGLGRDLADLGIAEDDREVLAPLAQVLADLDLGPGADRRG
jgi:glycosyltransferase involved in cell wall biosynthesis